MAVCVLIIDDHPLMRDAVRMTMDTVAPGSRIDLAASFAEARRLLALNTAYDFTLLDLNLPDSAGFEALKALRAQYPQLPTVGCSRPRSTARPFFAASTWARPATSRRPTTPTSSRMRCG